VKHSFRALPSGALVFSIVSHGGSWILLASIAALGMTQSLDGQVVAWIHLIALGWFSMAALGILIHVVPSFTDLTWRHEKVARRALGAFGAGIALFVTAWLALPGVLVAGALLSAGAFATYLAAASATLWQGRRAAPTERAISRALALTLWTFFTVSIIGVLMVLATTGAAPPSLLSRLPQAHAELGFYGWLTLLVFGVSTRAVRPISGTGSRLRGVHAFSAASVFGGAVVLALGLGTGVAPLVIGGAVLVALGACAYVVDTADILRRASIRHRPPQAFIGAAVVWLSVSLVAGAGTLFGLRWQAAYGFLVLVGWVGQMVNAYMLHIGVRMLATFYRGESDQTRPGELLDPRLSWLTFGAFQTAITLCAAGLWGLGSAYVQVGAVLGFAGWCGLIADVAVARRRARRPRTT
jgi:hypothetical protein